VGRRCDGIEIANGAVTFVGESARISNQISSKFMVDTSKTRPGHTRQGKRHVACAITTLRIDSDPARDRHSSIGTPRCIYLYIYPSLGNFRFRSPCEGLVTRLSWDLYLDLGDFRAPAPVFTPWCPFSPTCTAVIDPCLHPQWVE
jgi:hypothetical protein